MSEPSKRQDPIDASAAATEAGLPRGAAMARYEIFLVIAVAMVVLLVGMSSYTLIDPWETHYAEVARRILAEHDWVFLHAEDQSFRSKPALTFWLIAGSMKLLGVAANGGYSGELTNSATVIFAVRLPFALFGVLGLTMLWSMLAKLVNRRVAWISFVVLLSSPFYLLVARQSITDMPMVATLLGAMCCFALAVHGEEDEIRPFWGRVNALHVFIATTTILIGSQIAYLFYYFAIAHPGVSKYVNIGPASILWPLLVVFTAWTFSILPEACKFPKLRAFPIRTKRQLNMLWFFLLIGISVLAKGPPGIALAGLVCLLYILLTRDWKLLLKLELIRGPLLTALVSLPWHFAMFLKDGPAWSSEYINHHMLKRFGNGVHGDSGTFDYFATQLGIGMWPWIALVPAALVGILYSARRDTQEGRVRLIAGIWVIAGFATFCASVTKFHHYALPVVPALAIMIGFWIDDALRGRIKRSVLLLLLAVAIVLLIARDLVGEQKQIIELFIYRYDRPWPSGKPWFLDLSAAFAIFGALFATLFALMSIGSWRRVTVPALLLGGMAFGLWTSNVYMPKAAAHWGQRALHAKYYAMRQIHGLDLEYYSLRDLSDEWANGDDVLVQSVLPEKFSEGSPMKVQIFVPGAGIPEDRVILSGVVSRLGENRFWIKISEKERDKLGELIERGGWLKPSRKRPWRQVNADRMIAWQLNWHGEDFWTAGEMYGARDDAKTVFKSTNNEEFLKWIKDPERANRTYFIVTEAGRARGLQGILPTPRAKKSHEILDDTSCNKFTLVRFSL